MYLICLFSLLICVVAKNTTRLEEIKSDLSRLELKIDKDKYQVKQIENAIKVLKSGVLFTTIKSEHGTERKLRIHNIEEIERENIILHYGICRDLEIVKYYHDFILTKRTTTTKPIIMNNNKETSYSHELQLSPISEKKEKRKDLTIFAYAVVIPRKNTSTPSSQKPTTSPNPTTSLTNINANYICKWK
jgi:hypothetical protein